MVPEANLAEREISQSVEPLLSVLCSELDDVALESVDLEVQDASSKFTFDAIARIQSLGQPENLAFEIKHNGQPRHVREGILKLKNAIGASGLNAYPVFVAPFLSEQSKQICKINETNYLDLAGNAYLKLSNLLVNISTGITPRPERRVLKSLFGTKASRIVRAMLSEPGRSWRVKDLAASAHTSLGLASNVRRGLLNHEWAQETHKGIVLTKPDLVLDAWNANYRPNFDEISLYTTLHGESLRKAIQQLFSHESTQGKVMYGSFSAARWIAPYGRTGTEFLFAIHSLLDPIMNTLNAVRESQGGNVMVQLTNDTSVLKDAIEPVSGVVCTSPLQTYLDLGRAGERGSEAADYLRQTVLTWIDRMSLHGE